MIQEESKDFIDKVMNVWDGIWKGLVFSYRVITNKFVFIPFTILGIIVGVNFFFDNYRLRSPIILSVQSPIEARKNIDYVSPIGTEEVQAKEIGSVEPIEPVEIEPETIGKSWTGKISYYSESGCLGCDPNQIMANGEKFDEKAMTIAFNRLPLNTVVRITNMETGKRAFALVTDRGGFEKYNRIADLSLRAYQEIDAKTDVTNVRIEEVPEMEQVEAGESPIK